MSTEPSLIRAIVVDDDPFSRAQVERELQRHAATVELVAQCESGEEGLRTIRAERPGLVFLDVQMPGMDGFGLLDAVGQRDFGVIFITSFDKYAIRAIRYSALDYLLKPIQPAEFDTAVAQFIAQREYLPARLEHLLARKPADTVTPDTLVVATRKGDRHLRTQDIIRCEADRNYTWFNLRRGERLLSSYTLSTYEEFLAENEFLRVHRSHIVNVKHVRSCSADGLITLSDGTELEVSRRKRTEVLNVLRER